MTETEKKESRRIEVPKAESRIWGLRRNIAAIDKMIACGKSSVLELMAARNGLSTADFLKAQVRRKEVFTSELERLAPKPHAMLRQESSAWRGKQRQGWPRVRYSLSDGPTIDPNTLSLITRTTGTISQGLTPPCADLSLGFVPATDHCFYYMDMGGNGNIVFWPDGSSESFPTETYTGDWSGTYTTRLWATVNSGDESLGVAVGLVFKYEIPAPSCDSSVAWGVKAITQASSSWLFQCGDGIGSTEWLHYADQYGRDFPEYESLSHTFKGFMREGSRDGVIYDHPYDERVIEGNMLVAGGTIATVYVGIVVWFRAYGGGSLTTYLGGPADDYFSLPWGLFYLMSKVNS